MYARVATFESDPASVDGAISTVREEVSGETPAGLEAAKMLMLVKPRERQGHRHHAVRERGSHAPR